MTELGKHTKSQYFVKFYGIVDSKHMKLIFEYIEGESLAELHLKADLDLDRRIRISKDLAEALMILHSFGIVHGDIKPENILITKDFQVKIIDFGISWKIGHPNQFQN